MFIDYINSISSKYKHNAKKLLILDYYLAHSTPGITDKLKNKKFDFYIT